MQTTIGGVNMKYVLTEMLRKASTLNDLELQGSSDRAKWKPIENEITLPAEMFDEFVNNLLDDHSWLEGEEGTLVIYKEGSEEEDYIAVQTEGYNYARYSGVVYAIKEG